MITGMMRTRKSESNPNNYNKSQSFLLWLFALVEAHDAIGHLIGRADNGVAQLAGDLGKEEDGLLAEMVRPLLVVGLAVAPHGIQGRIGLGGLVGPGEGGGDAEEHEQLVAHILPMLAAGELVQIHGLEAALGDLQMVGIAATGDVILDGLALPTDGVAVQVGVHVEHPLHIGQSPADIRLSS